MTLSRSLVRFIISTPNPNKWPLLRSPLSLFSTRTLAERAKTTNPNQPSTSDFPKPSEIPFQSKVANSVHLVGTIGEPVKFQTLAAGGFAASVLVQESIKKDGPKLRIPVIFQGDLAQIAACHLKEKDRVYVTGQLSSGLVPLTAEDKSKETVQSFQNHLQMLANSLSFVKKNSSGRESEMVYDQDDAASDCSEDANGPNRNAKSLWSDLLDNPQEWRDMREDKHNRKVSSKYPDFKRSTGEALWLNRAPDGVLSKLDGLIFCGINDTAKSCGTKSNSMTESSMGKSDGLASHCRNNMAKSSKEDLWKKLVENPGKWWDNRSNKFNPKSPDFKHKDTGEALWLGPSTPSWALSKLPPAPPKEVAKGDTLLSARTI